MSILHANAHQKLSLYMYQYSKTSEEKITVKM